MTDEPRATAHHLLQVDELPRDPMLDTQTEEQIRSLVTTLDVALILREVDPPRYVYVSPAFARIFGWPVEDLLSDPWFLRTHAHPEDRDVVSTRMMDLSEGPIPEIEWRIVRPDGEVRWVRAKRAFIATLPGAPQRIAGFIEDITERKMMEMDLERSRDWFDAIADTVPIGFAIRDAQTLRYEFVSAAYEQIFGRPRQDFYDDPTASYSLTHPDDLTLTKESFVSATTGETWGYEGRIVRPDGQVRWLRGHQRGAIGRGRGRWLASTVEDVTDRRASEAQLRILIEANIVGILVSDSEKVLAANDRFLEIIGYTQEDVLAGRIRWAHMTPPEWAGATETAARQVRDTGVCAPYEKEFFTKDGGRVPVLLGSAVLEPDPLKYSAVVLDLTEVKKVEIALRQAEYVAQQANEAKSAFLSRMSHELRTPLNAVIGFGQLLGLDELRDDQRESVDQIIKGGKHLLSLINEVLDISRIESGSLSLSLEPVQLSEVVSETLSLVRHLGDLRSVRIDDQCTEDCSEFVRADRQRLKQVVLNLVANAIKYNRNGGSVTVRCEQAGTERHRLVVSDTGIGIPEQGMDRLFAPFDRLGAEHTDVEGTGLGLALTKRLTEAMGGEIGAESVVGQGSTFWVELEVAPATDPDVGAADVTGDAAQPPSVASFTVLYIEDNRANVRLVERILALREGVGVTVAMQASVGLELARSRQPDLILLDLNLPDMSGHEALRRLRGDPATADIPVAVVSADATLGQIERLKAEGAVDYLAKPFDIAQLLRLVDQMR